MENASDALIMAASVLLLIIALSVSISSFSNMKSQVDSIITESESIDMAKDESGNYINYIKDADDIRIVDAGTVMSSIRRVFKEQYTLYIKDKDGQTLSTVVSQLRKKTEKEQYYNSNPLIGESVELIRFSLAGETYKYINDDVMKALYENIKDKKYKEYLGIYQEKTGEEISSANKQTFRVITFVEI